MKSISKILFIAIDYLFKYPQNPSKIIKKNRVSVYVERDVVFDKNTPEYKLDYFYKPHTTGKRPVIFEIHGGGFSAGDKKYRNALCYWFAHETGAFVVNVNYGLGREVQFPQPFIHLVNAANWVVDNAERFNLDLDKVLVTGDSAGGYYSSVLSVYNRCPAMQEACGGIPLKLKIGAAAFNCGIYDLKIALQTRIIFNMTKQVCLDFAGITPDQFDTYKYKDAVSPVDYIDENFPKSYIIYADKDVFCGGQGQALAKKLTECGVYNETYGSHKFLDNHTFPSTWISKAAKEANAGMIRFMNNYFAGKI